MTLGRLEPGAIFGEMALIDGSPRMATAVAVEATTVVVVKSADLEAKLAAADPFLARLLCMFVNNVRRITDAHLSGEPPALWDEGDRLDLNYAPDEIAQALVKGPFIRRNQPSAA